MSSRKERAKNNQESEEVSHLILMLLTENKGYLKKYFQKEVLLLTSCKRLESSIGLSLRMLSDEGVFKIYFILNTRLQVLE